MKNVRMTPLNHLQRLMHTYRKSRMLRWLRISRLSVKILRRSMLMLWNRLNLIILIVLLSGCQSVPQAVICPTYPTPPKVLMEQPKSLNLVPKELRP